MDHLVWSQQIHGLLVFKVLFVKEAEWWRASQVVLMVKNLLANAGDTRDLGSLLGWENSLEEKVTAHSSILAWRIPWTEKPGGLQSIGSQRVRHN